MPHYPPPLLLALCCLLPTLSPSCPAAPQASSSTEGQQQNGKLLAGAHSQNINPNTLPVWISGNIAAIQSDRIVDPLFARALVLDHPSNPPIAVCVVDSLAVPAHIVEQAKKLVADQTPLQPKHILVSATHSHSAPAAMGAHGTPTQTDYAQELPNRVAEAIISAYKKRTPAQVGYTTANADRFVHCRRWIMEPGHAGGVPFSGRESNIVAMNPGHDNPFKIRQTGEVDRTIPILFVKSADGIPLALLASFSTHYAGAPAISSDYFGVVSAELARQLRPDSPESFVGIMANATSGDTNCIDFSRPAKPFTYHEVGQYVASRILDALPNAQFDLNPTLNARFKTIEANVRLADPQELAQAKAYVQSKLSDRLPTTIEENYARETVLLSEMPPTRTLPLQALQIGKMVIAAFPTETYTATGQSVRLQSQFPFTLNIGLANDLAGYLPPANQFPLGGYTTWRARTSCLAEDTESRVVTELNSLIGQLHSSNHTQQIPEKPKIQHDGPMSAIPPEQTLELFELQSQQRIELVANEPNCIDPVAIRFDDAGNLWVVEMHDYPLHRPNQQRGSIRKLCDQNLDGIYESATLFATDLPYPTGIQFHQDGILLTAGGSLWFLRDTNNDGAADEQIEWLQGFAQENQQLRANDPDFGIDGKLYVANGLRSSKATLNSPNPITTDFANNDLRWDWSQGKGRGVAGPSQFGMSFDRYGNRYFCSNRNPCDAVLMEPWLAAKSPLAGIAPMTSPVLPPGERSSVFPLVSAWTTSNLHAGQFTAACGLLVSHSHHLPAASLGHALTCEPTGSLIHRAPLGRVSGNTLPEAPSSVNESLRQSEWLASHDPWFRPVNLEEGPDAAIYVVDMHRAVIEHPDWVPDELKTRPDERWGDQAGRIYRVLHRDAPTIDPIFHELRNAPLMSRPSRELVALLNHPRQWIRNTASRILFERLATSAVASKNPIDSNVFAEISSYLQSHSNPQLLSQHIREHSQGILLAIAIQLESDSLFNSHIAIPTICNLLARPHSEAPTPWRAALWKLLAERFFDDLTFTDSLRCEPASLNILAHLALSTLNNAPREETLAAASLLSLLPTPTITPDSSKELIAASVRCALDAADDPHLLMILAAVHQQHHSLDQFVCQAIDLIPERIDKKQLTRDFSTTAWKRLVATVADPSNQTWNNTKNSWLANSKARLAQVPNNDETARRIIDEPQMLFHSAIALGITASKDQSWIAEQSDLWQAYATQLTNPLWSQKLRKDWIALAGISLNTTQSQNGTKALHELLTSNSPQPLDPELKQAILTAWAKHPEHKDHSLTDWMLHHYDSETPALRSTMFAIFRNSPDRLERWLSAMENGTLANHRIDANQIQSLKQITGEIAPRIAKLLEGRVQSNRQSLVERTLKELNDKGLIETHPTTQPNLIKTDRQRGKQLFAQHCAACHRVDSVGTNIGPDISDSRTQTPAQLLVSILDPNRAIDNQYFRVSVRLNDGSVHDGIVSEESGEHITLKTQQNPALSIPKNSIDELVSSGVSLMPEGFEAQLTPADLADLIDYLKNWRYVGGESPQR